MIDAGHTVRAMISPYGRAVLEANGMSYAGFFAQSAVNTTLAYMEGLCPYQKSIKEKIENGGPHRIQ